jgi:hypothetical protein
MILSLRWRRDLVLARGQARAHPMRRREAASDGLLGDAVILRHWVLLFRSRQPVRSMWPYPMGSREPPCTVSDSP